MSCFRNNFNVEPDGVTAQVSHMKWNTASESNDFLDIDGFDAIMAVIHTDLLHNDEKLN